MVRRCRPAIAAGQVALTERLLVDGVPWGGHRCRTDHCAYRSSYATAIRDQGAKIVTRSLLR